MSMIVTVKCEFHTPKIDTSPSQCNSVNMLYDFCRKSGIQCILLSTPKSTLYKYKDITYLRLMWEKYDSEMHVTISWQTILIFLLIGKMYGFLLANFALKVSIINDPVDSFCIIWFTSICSSFGINWRIFRNAEYYY